jgi:ABC-2 type transport system permease protein
MTFEPQAVPPAVNATRPMYWSVKREIWENRSLYIAPLAVAALVLFGTFISLIGLPRRIRNVPPNDPAKLHRVVVTPFSMAPAPIMLTTLLVGFFYALDALYGERRERSILFWKSLPVSDRTTVLSKAAIPLVVLPLIACVLGWLAQLFLLMVSALILPASGMSPAAVWGEFNLVQEPLVMLYGMTAHSLWFAPIYAWLLLISAWARRTPILWALLPPAAIAMLERMIFNTKYFANLLKYRFTGAMQEGFAVDPKQHTAVIDKLWQLSPGRFLSAPGLWLGLLFAAACLAAAIRLRRNREPI